MRLHLSALSAQALNIAQALGEPEVEPNRTTNGVRWRRVAVRLTAGPLANEKRIADRLKPSYFRRARENKGRCDIMIIDRKTSAQAKSGPIRITLAALALALSACGVGSDVSVAPPIQQTYVPGDPLTDHEIYRRVTARGDERPFFVTVNGNIYGFGDQLRAIPIVSVFGLWTYKLEEIDGSSDYISRRVYCGSFSRFGTDEAVESLVNPITGKEVMVRKSRLENPAFFNTVTPQGIFGTGDFRDVQVFPREGPRVPLSETRIVGGQIHLVEERFNQEIIGIPQPWYEELTWTADLGEVKAGSSAFVPSNRIINISQSASIREWLGIESEDVYISVHASGRKVESTEGIPENTLHYVKENCPHHLDGTVWDGFSGST